MNRKPGLIALAFVFLFSLINSPAAQAKKSNKTSKKSKILRQVEDHYRAAKTVRMTVAKTVTMKLLEKEKKSEGTILVKRGGRLRWETSSPERSLILVTKEAVWFVEYPVEEGEKISILKAANPKKSQPQALVAFLLGEGRIGDDFEITKESPAKNGTVTLELHPKLPDAQVQWLKLIVNKKKKEIKNLSFEDTVGNLTVLDFKSLEFNATVSDDTFKFTPPANSETTVID